MLVWEQSWSNQSTPGHARVSRISRGALSPHFPGWDQEKQGDHLLGPSLKLDQKGQTKRSLGKKCLVNAEDNPEDNKRLTNGLGSSLSCRNMLKQLEINQSPGFVGFRYMGDLLKNMALVDGIKPISKKQKLYLEKMALVDGSKPIPQKKKLPSISHLRHPVKACLQLRRLGSQGSQKNGQDVGLLHGGSASPQEAAETPKELCLGQPGSVPKTWYRVECRRLGVWTWLKKRESKGFCITPWDCLGNGPKWTTEGSDLQTLQTLHLRGSLGEIDLPGTQEAGAVLVGGRVDTRLFPRSPKSCGWGNRGRCQTWYGWNGGAAIDFVLFCRGRIKYS